MEPTLGPYQLLEQLGEGGAGVVYRARDVRDGQEIALKLLLRPTAQRMGRFQLEAETLAKLRHPNVVPVRDYGIAGDGRPYLVLELIQGHTLQERLDTTGPLRPQEAVEVALQLAAALSAAHGREILHRDVKPENVLLRASDGVAILGDFGLAKDLGSQLDRLTQTGTIMGTPGYLAPEQLGHSGEHSPALDVYGVGATLYAMLTGGPPVTGSSALEAFQATLSQAPIPPSRLVPLPPGLEAICLRCLAKDPAERYPNALALLDALEALETGGPAPSARRPHPALLLVLVGVGGAAGWHALGKSAPPLRPSVSSPAVKASAPGASIPPQPSAKPTSTPLAPTELEDLLNRCDRALALHAPGAAELVREAERLAPDHARTQLYLGVLSLRKRKSALAFDHLSRAIQLDASLASAYSVRAQVHIGRGDLPRAKRDVELALAANPESNTAWATLGKLRGLEGDYKGALSALDKAVQIFPKGALHRADRAAVQIALGRHKLALPDAERAVELGPHLAHPWGVRADLKRALSDPTSLEDYDQALELDPDHLGALTGRAAEYLNLSRYDEVIRDTTRVLSLAPSPNSLPAERARSDRSVAYLFRGDLADALRDLEELQRAEPNRPRHAFWRSEAHFRLGEFAESVKWSKTTLKLREAALADRHTPRNEIPGLSRTLAKQARAQHLLGDTQGSLESLQRSIKAAHRRDPYPRLWATALTGDPQFVKTWPDPDPWPRPIREYLLGRLSQAQLLEVATAKSARAICQSRTFFGIVAERQGKHSQARVHYRAALETGLSNLDDYAWSELRLR